MVLIINCNRIRKIFLEISLVVFIEDCFFFFGVCIWAFGSSNGWVLKERKSKDSMGRRIKVEGLGRRS